MPKLAAAFLLGALTGALGLAYLLAWGERRYEKESRRARAGMRGDPA
jgi:hypothetical protein